MEAVFDHPVVHRLLLQAAQAAANTSVGWQGWLVVVTLVLGLIVMAFDWIGPDLILAGLAALYMACRIITLQEGCVGFSNSGVLTVIALYAVAEGIAQTGGLERLMTQVMGTSDTLFWALLRMFVPVAFVAAFLNNTPIVAMMIPILLAWGNQRGISPKKLLIPMSYATILGGTCTLIGTSTNLVISGLQAQRYRRFPELAAFNFFDITPYGLTYLAFGFVYIMMFSGWLLPSGAVGGRGERGMRVVLRVKRSSKAVGKTLDEVGINTHRDAAVVAVVRDSVVCTAPKPEFTLQSGDDLYLSASVPAAEGLAEALDLYVLTASAEQHNTKQLDSPGFSDDDTPRKEGHPAPLDRFSVAADPEAGVGSFDHTKTVWGVIRKKSELIGQRIGDLDLDRRFDLQVLAFKRTPKNADNQPKELRLSDIVLQRDDQLVLVAGPAFDPKDKKQLKQLKHIFAKLDGMDGRPEQEYMTTVTTPTRSHLRNKTLMSAGLHGVGGLATAVLERADGTKLSGTDINPSVRVQANDKYIVTGSLEGIKQLRRTAGLVSTEQHLIDKSKVNILHRRLIQAVVADHPSLVGQTARTVDFQKTYGGVLLAIGTHGLPRIGAKLEDIRFQPGDVLLIDAVPGFTEKHSTDRSFHLLREVPKSSPLKSNRMWFALALVVILVGLQIFTGASGIATLDLFPGSVLVAGIMIATRCMSGQDARRSINWEVYICIAFSFAVSRALEKTNVASTIAGWFQDLSEAIGGQSAALVSMYIATGLLSEIITNNAAAALMYPIAATLGDSLRIPPMLVSVSIMLGASASFIIPVGYQCNLMVYAAGNYKTANFFRYGVPMQLVQIGGAMVALCFTSSPWLVTGITMGAAIVWVAVLGILRLAGAGILSRIALGKRGRKL